MNVVKKKGIAIALTSFALVLTLMLAPLFQESSGMVLAATHESQLTAGSIPAAPSASWTFTGMYLRIGINSWGTFIDTKTGVGWEYPLGKPNECLAVAWWGEGYTVAYKTEISPGVWQDNIAYCEPGYGLYNLVEWAASVARNDDNFAKVIIRVNTADGVLQLVFDFSFPKHQKYVNLRTFIRVIGKVPVRDVIYKRFVDWDIHWATYNEWTTDSHSAYARHYNESTGYWYEMTVSGYVMPYPMRYISYAEAYGWDDRMTRDPGYTLQNHGVPVWFDGAAMITYDCGPGDCAPGTGVGQLFTIYQAGENWYSPPG